MNSGNAHAALGRLVPIFGLSLLAACASSGSFDGKLVDPTNKQPRANIRIVAKAVSGGDVTCQSREATTGPDGAFTIPDTCADHNYVLHSGDDTLILEGDLKIEGGKPSEGVKEIEAWRAPKGDGVYVVSGDSITEVRKAADVYWEPVFPDPKNFDTYEKARYPSVVPNSVPAIPSGAYLAIAGEDNITDLKVLPLIDVADEVVIARPDKGAGTTSKISGASWVGLRFKGKTVKSTADVEKVEPALDMGKVKDLKGKGWATRLVAADALPAGRYAIVADAGSRMYIVDLGGQAAPAAPAAEPAAPAGGAAPPAGG